MNNAHVLDEEVVAYLAPDPGSAEKDAAPKEGIELSDGFALGTRQILAENAGLIVPIGDGACRLKLRRFDGTYGWATLDSEDTLWANEQGSWYEVPDGQTSYAVRFSKGSSGQTLRHYLHRELVSAAQGVHIDHINGDGLDCRRANLRVLSPSQNAQNRRGANKNSRSGIRGVRWHERDQRFISSFKLQGREIILGYFREREDAEAVVIAARRLLMPFSSAEKEVEPATLTTEEIDRIVRSKVGRILTVQPENDL